LGPHLMDLPPHVPDRARQLVGVIGVGGAQRI
jgi:hypothetical protein